MRITTLSDCPLVPHQGSGYVILSYDRELRRLGHDVRLVGPDDLVLPRRLGRKGRQYRIMLGMAREAIQAARQKSADVLHMYGEECWLACALLKNRRSRPRLVHHSNGVRAHMAQVQALNSVAPHRRRVPIPYHRAFTDSDLVVTVSGYDRRYVVDFGLKEATDVLAIPNSLADEARARRGDGPRIREVLFAGWWLANKGKDAIVADIPIFLRNHPDWRFRAIGVDEPADAVQEFPADVRERICLESPTSDRERVYDAMERCSLLVVPSIYESFGLVAVEGMACGCIVVATPTGFASDLTDGEEVFTIDSRAAHGLSSALERALQHEALWPEVRERARRRVEPLRWEIAGARLATAFQSLVAGQPVQAVEDMT